MKTQKNKIFALISTIFLIITIVFYIRNTSSASQIVYEGYINRLNDLEIDNIVTAIYLDFRLFDTIFEALLLLVAVIAITKFTNIHESEDNKEIVKFKHDKLDDYRLIKYTLSIIYPILVIFGFYMIYNGADSPGGGFQGGAILATLIMSRYLASDTNDISTSIPYILEKIIYIFILISSVYFFLKGVGVDYYRAFILLMNILIGIKVSLGFSTIFIKLVNGDL